MKAWPRARGEGAPSVASGVAARAGLVTAILALGCSSTAPITTAQDLAAALQRQGIQYQNLETSDMPANMRHAQIDEALVMTGDALRVDILRIEDERTFNMMRASVVLLGAAEAKVGKPLPGRPDVFEKAPFVVVVRQEPQAGAVRAALDKIWPDS